MIRSTGYDFSKIIDRVNAAENLQRAGCEEDADKILHDLAKEIMGGK